MEFNIKRLDERLLVCFLLRHGIGEMLLHLVDGGRDGGDLVSPFHFQSGKGSHHCLLDLCVHRVGEFLMECGNFILDLFLNSGL